MLTDPETLPAGAGATPPAGSVEGTDRGPRHRARHRPSTGTGTGTGTGRRAAHIAPRVLEHLGLIVAFSIPAVILWWHAWDGHLGSTLACQCGDPGQQVWFVAWPAHALAHLQNPFSTNNLNAPNGADLLSSTSSIAVGTAAAPATWLFGPIVSTNLVLTVVPGLTAWGCFVAARYFTRSVLAAVVAAVFFGYSPFVVENVAQGHVQIALLVVPPLAMVVGYELAVVQKGRPWLWGLALAGLIALQFMISTEILTVMAFLAAFAAVGWALLSWRTVTARITYLAKGLATAAGASAVLLAYPTWYALAGPQHVSGQPWAALSVEGLRVFDWWNPGPYSHPATFFTRIGGYEGLQGPILTYIGYTGLFLALAATIVAIRRRLTRLLILITVVATACGVGVFAWTSTRHALDVSWLPWQSLGKLPLLDRVGPVRFMAAIVLCMAVVIALGIGTVRRWRTPWARNVATAVAVVAAAGAVAQMWWTYQLPLHTERVSVPAWYTTAATALPSGTVLLTYPFPMTSSGQAQPMVWQAVDGMRFTLAGGYLKIPTKNGTPLQYGPPGSAVDTLGLLSQPAMGPLPRATPTQIANLRAALARWKVDEVVVADRGVAPVYAAAFITGVMGRLPTVSHGAWVWDVEPGTTPSPRVSPAAGAAAVRACVPVPAYGLSPPGRPLPMAGPQCVAAHLTAGG